MQCKICQNEFIPNKYHPHQQVCFQLECRRKRQIQTEREWRIKNPNYFKSIKEDLSWREYRRRYNRLWKASHKDSLKKYKLNHHQTRREYMREYMRRYRKSKVTLTDAKVSFSP